MNFKVGDKVIMVSGDYSITTKGSIGTVIELRAHSNIVCCEWDVLTGDVNSMSPSDKARKGSDWAIETRHLKLATPLELAML